jgi:hypothetical protein
LVKKRVVVAAERSIIHRVAVITDRKKDDGKKPAQVKVIELNKLKERSMANPNPKNNLPRDKDGKIIKTKGRAKGTTNKITREVKEAIALAFEGIGGLDRLIKWADKNPSIFYTQLYTKLIPVTLLGHVNATVESGDDAGQFLEHLLNRIIAERKQSAELPVVVDVEPERDPVPQLVVSRKTGSEAA